MPVPPVEMPNDPLLLNIDNISRISWQGSLGASAYDVLRSESADGPWITAGFNISDAEAQYTPLFNDESAEIGKEYYYCVVAKNSAGNSGMSNIEGPVKVEYLAYVDDLKTLTKTYYISGKITQKTDNDRDFREKMYRLQGEGGTEVIYKIGGIIKGLKVYSFAKTEDSGLEFSLSNDAKNFNPVTTEKQSPVSSSNIDYAYWTPEIYSTNNIGEKAAYLKISFKDMSQLSRVEIYYIK
jgi:hypothetical protein